MKKCPFCAEQIQDEAIVCRYCGRELPNTRYYMSPQVQQQKVTPAKPKKSLPTWLLIISGIFMFVCVSCIGLSSLFAADKDTVKPTNTAKVNISVVISTFTDPAPTHTDTPLPTATHTTLPTSTPSLTPTFTIEPGTQTAVAQNQAATQRSVDATATVHVRLAHASQTAEVKGKNATGTAVQISKKATGTAHALSEHATQVAQYSEINANELVTYPENHQAELVIIRGRVFNVISNTDFQIWIDGLSHEAVYITMVNAYDDLYENDHVTIYGLVAGEACGTNAFGGSVCQPQIVGTFYEKK